MKFKLLFITSMFMVLSAFKILAQESAVSILEKATQKAKVENKHVFIMFHASWCGWCKKMDKNMQNKACKAFFDDNYVIDHLVINESEDKKYLENPGAQQLLEKYKGINAGIPFWLIFDQNGNLITDSFNSEGQNIGCPVSKKEVNAFVEKLKKSSSLTQKELDIIAAVFIGV
ncbi:thioredoxin family protein [Flavobacteriaceae bacterium XHP0103]|uniref:thioredoxin family protein n=1 Tax=Marixanthotalea marina TaxID=2844359 RepID=UPI002989E636|nr:thioredoxin family protein [Marixanthotalea marina]MBU3822255.1 thioredoxin family protein [Marixanthotalea marina]